MRDVLLFGQSIERLLGIIYEIFSDRFPQGSVSREILTRLAEEEYEHADAMGKLVVVIETEGSGIHLDYRRITEDQGRFLDEATLLLRALRDDSAGDVAAIVHRLQALETSLSESLFGFLGLLTSVSARGDLSRLANQSDGHAELLGAVAGSPSS